MKQKDEDRHQHKVGGGAISLDERTWDNKVEPTNAEINPFLLPDYEDSKKRPDEGSLASVVQESLAYAWLVSRIRLEAASETAVPASAATLGTSVINMLEPAKVVNQSIKQNTYEIIVNVHLAVTGFFSEQQYESSAAATLANIICLTGSGNFVQASTCLDYVAQVWPQSGPQLIKEFERMLAGNISEPQNGLTPTLSLRDTRAKK